MGNSITRIDSSGERLNYATSYTAMHSTHIWMHIQDSFVWLHLQKPGPVPPAANIHGNVSEAEHVDCNQWLIITPSLSLFLSPGVTWSFLTEELLHRQRLVTIVGWRRDSIRGPVDLHKHTATHPQTHAQWSQAVLKWFKSLQLRLRQRSTQSNWEGKKLWIRWMVGTST